MPTEMNSSVSAAEHHTATEVMLENRKHNFAGPRQSTLQHFSNGEVLYCELPCWLTTRSTI
jgi:hypothetical protein